MVSIPTSLTPILGPVQQCASEYPDLTLIIEQLSRFPQDLRKNNLYLWWGEPPPGETFAVYLATEEIVVVLHPANSVDRLDLDELSDLFTGQVRSWDEFGGPDEEVIVWTYPPGSDLYQILKTAVIEDQGVSPFARLVPNPQAMLEAVSTDPGAIGTLPEAWISSEIKPAKLFNQQQINLSKPILALSNGQPEGGALNLIACLQSPASRNRLTEIYSP